MKLEFSGLIFLKIYSNIKFYKKISAQGKPSYSMRMDGRTDRYDEGYSHFFAIFVNAPYTHPTTIATKLPSANGRQAGNR